MRRTVLALSLLVACKRDPDRAPAPSAKPVVTVIASASSGSGLASSPPSPPPPLARADVDTFFKPLPKTFAAGTKDTDAQIGLGRMLWFEGRLSKNHEVSCNSCHDLERFGVDGLKLSLGHATQTGTRNSPTAYNAGGHVAQFWDGRAKDLEEQAKGPITNPVEMASSEARVVATIRSIPGYASRFRDAYPGKKLSLDLVAQAIAAFERGLVTPSRFDKYLMGDETALTDTEKGGLALFVKLGCTTCHNGPAVGGASFQKLGLLHPWTDEKDLGRFVVTKNAGDKLKFRVPTLRNVARTGPWFHDGSMTKLEDVVRKMAWHQLDKELRDDEVALIVAFLNALTGELPRTYIARPELPESATTTPKPDPT